MLPPVRVALSSNTDYPHQFQPAAGRVSMTTPPASGDMETEAGPPLSGGRSDALSLSSQLRLAQGSSIFAETLGRLLKMPRQENETLEDYTARLFEAAQALKPSERAAVERLLNQIVKGISLRLLAEILRNPTGPDAARLTSYIEAASAAEQDLAAKAVVSSYRQNGSMDAPVNANSPPPEPARSQMPGTTATTTLVPAVVPEDASAEAPLPAAAVREQAETPQRGDARAATETKNSPVAGGAAPAGGQPTGGRNDGITTMQPGPAAMSGPDGGDGIAKAGSRDAAGGRSAIGSSGSDASGGDLPARAAGNEGPASGAARLYDGPALVRHSLESARNEKWQGLRGDASGTDRAMPDAASLLAEVMADIDLPQQPQLAGRPTGPASATTVPTGDEAGASQHAAGETTGEGSGAARQSTDTEAPQLRNQAMEAAPPARNPQQSASGPDQPIGALPGAWPAVARDGIPLPYVPYPPEEHEPRREDRKARAIAEIGDEEDEAPAQDQGFREETDGDNGDEEGAGRPEGRDTDDNDDEGRPNDLYWRMAGWN